MDSNVKIAGKRRIICTLRNCFALDVAIQCLDYSPTAKLLATCSDKMIHFWNIGTNPSIEKIGKSTKTLFKGHHIVMLEPIHCCAFSKSGAVFAACSKDSRIIVWNVQKMIVSSYSSDSIQCI